MTENKHKPVPKRPGANVRGVGNGRPDRPGVGLNFKDGWNFGIGFGLAMAIAVPLIVMLLGCVVIMALAVVGSEIGALL